MAFIVGLVRIVNGPSAVFRVPQLIPFSLDTRKLAFDDFPHIDIRAAGLLTDLDTGLFVFRLFCAAHQFHKLLIGIRIPSIRRSASMSDACLLCVDH